MTVNFACHSEFTGSQMVSDSEQQKTCHFFSFLPLMQQAGEFEYPFREFRKLKMTASVRQLAGAKFRENETEKVDAHHF